jgi:hypothetical protein
MSSFRWIVVVGRSDKMLDVLGLLVVLSFDDSELLYIKESSEVLLIGSVFDLLFGNFLFRCLRGEFEEVNSSDELSYNFKSSSLTRGCFSDADINFPPGSRPWRGSP